MLNSDSELTLPSQISYTETGFQGRVRSIKGAQKLFLDGMICVWHTRSAPIRAQPTLFLGCARGVSRS